MKKVALGALIVLVIGIVGLFTVSGSIFSIGKNVEINERETISPEDIKEMKVSVDVGEVRIKESESDEIDIHFHGSVPKQIKDQLKFKVEEHSSSVEVIVSQSKKFFVQIPFITSDIYSERILDISLPKSLLDKLEVKADVGDLDIEGIDTTQLTAHSDVGDISINKVRGALNVVSNVGDIKLEKVNGKTNAHTDSGEVDISFDEMTDDLNLSSDVGDINVTFAKIPENIAFDLRSDVGEVSITGIEGFENTSSGSVMTQIGNEGPLLEAKTDVGDITIEK
jgi:Putative adhesin